MLAADCAEIGCRLFMQIAPAFSADRRLAKVKKWLIAEPAIGGENGTTHDIQGTSQYTHNRAPGCHLGRRKRTGFIYELAARLLAEDAPPE